MNVNLTRTDSISTNGLIQMSLVINSSDSIIPQLFVKQRFNNLDGSNNDQFVTVANAQDIVNYGIGTPLTGSNLFLDSSVSFINNEIAQLDNIFNEVLYLLQLVCGQVSDTTTPNDTVTYTITPSGSSISS